MVTGFAFMWVLCSVQAAAPAAQIPLSFRAFYFYESPEIALVPISVQIGRGSIAVRKENEKWIGKESLSGIATREDGTKALEFAWEVNLAFRDDQLETFLKRDLTSRHLIRLKPGNYNLKLAISDEKGAAGSAELDLSIPNFVKSGITASSLILSQETHPAVPKGSLLLSPPPADPLEYRGFQIIAPVEADMDPKRPMLVFYRIYFTPESTAKTSFQIKVQVIEENGAVHEFPPVDTTKSTVAAAETQTAVGFLLPFSELKPGKYQLTVETLPSGGSKSTTVTADFQLRDPGGEAEAETADKPDETNTSNATPADDNRWTPPEFKITANLPESSPTCPLPVVLEGAARRVEELMHDVDSFTATEVLEHREANRQGVLGAPETRKFDYMVSIREIRPGIINVEEFRDREYTPHKLPGQTATVGTPTLVLIFHPRYVRDFDMVCEGLGQWGGQPAWQIRFEQRKDRPNNLRAFHVNEVHYGVRIQGRAWIREDTNQIVHLEVHVADPIPKIRLKAEHMNIDYQPVDFPEKRMQLWLPKNVELFTDMGGRRYRRRHSFTNYKLFSVETKQEISSPKPKTPNP